MHGLPKDVDLSFMLNKELSSVSIGYHNAQLHLTGEPGDIVRIRVENDFTVVASSGIENLCKTAKDCGAHLPEIIGQTLTEAESSTDGTLILTFSNGFVVVLRDDDHMYEVYQISHKGREKIVV